MASRRSDKEQLRQERQAREQREERAKRRERHIYIGLGAGLLVLAAVVLAIVSSRSSTAPSLPAAAPSSQALAVASSAPAGGSTGAVLTANVRQANQILDTTIQRVEIAHPAQAGGAQPGAMQGSERQRQYPRAAPGRGW